MWKEIERPKLSPEREDLYNLMKWAENSHYWVEQTQDGGFGAVVYRCQWCGKVMNTYSYVGAYDKLENIQGLCEKNPIVMRMLAKLGNHHIW